MFTFFASQESITPQPRDWSWQDFVDDVMKGHHPTDVNQKNYCWHFNATTYKEGGRRSKVDIIAINAVILDFDDYVSWERMVAYYSEIMGLEFVAFTSFNHQRNKVDGDEPRDKFRMVFPLKQPITLNQYTNITDYLLTEFAPKADRVLGNPSQHYTYNFVARETAHLSKTHYHKGDWLDYESIPKNKLESVGGAADASLYVEKKAAHHLPADFLFKTDKGVIRFCDVNKRISKVYCPHHNDKSPGTFLNKAKNTIYHYCPKCGTTKIEYKGPSNTDAGDDDSGLIKSAPVKVVSVEKASMSDILVFPDIEAVEPFTRSERIKLMEKTLGKKTHPVTLLEAFEGFGKSYHATLCAKQGKKVLFASLSNEQAAEQAESFKQQGLKVQLVPGREYRLRTEFKVEVTYHPQSHPWDGERVDEKKTLTWMVNNLKMDEVRAREIWNMCSPPEPDFINHNIICTTMTRTRAYGAVQHSRAHFIGGKAILKDDEYIVPPNTMVFFDDPDKSEFTWKYPYTDSFKERQEKRRQKKGERTSNEGLQEVLSEAEDNLPLIINQKPVKEVEINKRRYYIRPKELILGFGLYNTNLVFTTTEMLTCKLIDRMYKNIYKPKLMPDEKMKAGEITMIKTNLTSSKLDGLIPPILKRLEKDGFKFKYIGDGQGSRFNLTNNKGQNIFKDDDIVVEISQPHMNTVVRYVDELDWDDSNMNVMKVVLALDSVQQAIGRNSGYRWSDAEPNKRKKCVVLCAPFLFNDLIKYMRYFVDQRIDDPKKKAEGFKLGRTYRTLEEGLCWFITNLNRYLMMREAVQKVGMVDLFWDDIQSVYGECEDKPKRRKFRDRLIKAIHSVVEKTKDEKLVDRLQELLIKKLGD